MKLQAIKEYGYETNKNSCDSATRHCSSGYNCLRFIFDFQSNSYTNATANTNNNHGANSNAHIGGNRLAFDVMVGTLAGSLAVHHNGSL